MKNTLLSLAFLVTSAALSPTTARAQNLLTNGSFESGLSGWSSSGSVVSAGNEGTTDGTSAARFNYGNVVGDGVLSQSFATNIGQTYRLTFDYGGYGNSGRTLGFQTEVISATTRLTQVLGDPGSIPTTFTTFSFDFTADSTSTLLRFTDITSFSNSQAADLVLDRVRVLATQSTFVGSWRMDNINGGYGNPSNPWIWSANPQSMSAVETAAFLYGGSPADYEISTAGNNPASINHRAWVDGFGDGQYMIGAGASESFKLQTGTGYADPGGSGTAYSAYVVDRATSTQVNYAFRVAAAVTTAAAPEPGTLSLLALGACAALIGRRRRGTK